MEETASPKKRGRKAKYETAEAAYAARLASNKKWRLAHPRQWKRIQAEAYKRRKYGYQRKRRKPVEVAGF